MDNYYITIQARIGSKRFPSKIMKLLWQNKYVLEFMIERLCTTFQKDRIYILTTDNPNDQEIIDLCDKLNINSFRGDENNVMKRMNDFIINVAGNSYIVDLTSDCPLVDPKLIENMLLVFIFYNLDYISNVLTRSYPDGMDIQIYKSELITYLFNKINMQENHLQHTGWNIINYSLFYNPPLKIMNWSASKTEFNPDWRLCLDYPEDLCLLQKIIKHFNCLEFTTEDITKYLLQNPNLLKINNRKISKIPGIN